MPDESVLYFADTLRVPYGGRAPEEIVRFNKEILSFFSGIKIKMVIMACGTSSAIAYPIVKDMYKFPIISLIEPGSLSAIEKTKNKKIGVIATQATVNSGAYERYIKKREKNVKVLSVACPLFVPLVEGGFVDAEETKNIAREYLRPLLKDGIDTIILGCTHYPHLIRVLREITGASINFVNPAETAVIEAKNILQNNNLLSQKSLKKQPQFFVSGSIAQFKDIASRLLQRDIGNLTKVKIQKTGKIEVEV